MPASVSRRKLAVFGAFVLVCSTSAFLYADPMGLFGPKLIDLCEAEIKERLVSPSGYRRISVTENAPRLADRDEIMGWSADSDNKAFQLRLALKDHQFLALLRHKAMGFKGGSWTHSLQIAYDAPNSYNAPIRATSECSFVSSQTLGSLPKSVMIDGQDNLDWSLSQMRKTNGSVATISDADANRAITLLDYADGRTAQLTAAECTWLIDTWDHKRSIEAITKYGAPTGEMLAECRLAR